MTINESQMVLVNMNETLVGDGRVSAAAAGSHAAASPERRSFGGLSAPRARQHRRLARARKRPPVHILPGSISSLVPFPHLSTGFAQPPKKIRKTGLRISLSQPKTNSGDIPKSERLSETVSDSGIGMLSAECEDHLPEYQEEEAAQDFADASSSEENTTEGMLPGIDETHRAKDSQFSGESNAEGQ